MTRIARSLALISTAIVVGGLMTGPAQAATPRCFGERATIAATKGDDRIQGTRRRDVIVGLGGADVIRGGGRAT